MAVLRDFIGLQKGFPQGYHFDLLCVLRNIFQVTKLLCLKGVAYGVGLDGYF